MQKQLDRVIPGRLTRIDPGALRHCPAIHCLSRPLLRDGTILRNGASRTEESRAVTSERVGGNELCPRAEILERAQPSRVNVSVGRGGRRC